MPSELATGADRLPLPSTLTAGQQAAVDKVAAGPRGEVIAPVRPAAARPGADDAAAAGRRVPALRPRAPAAPDRAGDPHGRATLGSGLRVGPSCAARPRRRPGRGRHRRGARRRHVHRSRRRPCRVATGQRTRIPPRRQRFDVRRGTARRRRRRSRRADRHRRLLHDAGHDHERRPHAGARRLRAPASPGMS